MALATTTSYFQNSIVGQMQVGADIDIYSVQTSTPRYPVGQGFTRGDGNKYRYAFFASAVTAGRLCSTTVSDNMANTSNAVIAPASAVAVSGESIKPGNKGSRYVEMTIASVGAQQYAGGYFVVFGGTGAGYTYRVKGNTVTGDPATGNIRIELWEKLKLALDTTSDVCITMNPYNDIAIYDTTTNLIPVGICVSSASASNYAWVQTAGVVGVLCSATLCTALGQPIQPSTTVNGAVMRYSDATTTGSAIITSIGKTLALSTAGDLMPCYISIE